MYRSTGGGNDPYRGSSGAGRGNDPYRGSSGAGRGGNGYGANYDFRMLNEILDANIYGPGIPSYRTSGPHYGQSPYRDTHGFGIGTYDTSYSSEPFNAQPNYPGDNQLTGREARGRSREVRRTSVGGRGHGITNPDGYGHASPSSYHETIGQQSLADTPYQDVGTMTGMKIIR